MTTPDLIPASEVARIYGCHVRTVHRLVAKGDLTPAIKAPGAKGAYLFRRADADRTWLAANPQRTNELMWTNPRYVFFKEEPLVGMDAGFGPKGAQGVPLTPGRSIAVDPGSIPYGAAVWLTSTGNQTNLQKLVLAQDTGAAITGAVRADYFAGWGPEAAELAGRLRQPLQMWILWPK